MLNQGIDKIDLKDSKRDIAVIIPAYNCRCFIGAAIDSVYSQTLQPKEVIVIDDGSTDNLKEVIGQYLNVKYVYQEHEGVCAARNKGISVSTAGWIAFLDSDDVWMSDHLEKVMFLIRKYDLVWACGAMKVLSLKGKEIKMTRRWRELLVNGDLFKDFFEAFAMQAHFLLSATIIRKDVILAAGLFDVKFNIHVDYDLFFRIAVKYPKIGFVWPATVYRRIRKGSITYGKRINAILLLRKHKKIFSFEENPPSQGCRSTAEYLISQTIFSAVEKRDGRPLRELLAEQGVLLKNYSFLRFLIWTALFFPLVSYISLGLFKFIKRTKINLLD